MTRKKEIGKESRIGRMKEEEEKRSEEEGEGYEVKRVGESRRREAEGGIIEGGGIKKGGIRGKGGEGKSWWSCIEEKEEGGEI